MTNTARRILIVEDEPMIAGVLEMVLEDMGCVAVGPAATLEEALAAVSPHDIDGAVVDLNLSGRSALPVAERLRDCAIPIIFSSGHSETTIKDQFPGSLWLRKPFKLDAIVAAVNQAVPVKPTH